MTHSVDVAYTCMCMNPPYQGIDNDSEFGGFVYGPKVLKLEMRVAKVAIG